MRKLSLVFIFALFTVPGLCFADTATLRNGREIHGKLIRETKSYIELRIAQGGKMRIRKSDIATFTENGNYGLEYGKGGVAKDPKSSDKKDGTEDGVDKGQTPNSADKGKPKTAEDAFRASLPKPSSDWKDEDLSKMFATLYASRKPEDSFLPKTQASSTESEEIKRLIGAMGYSRKAGNRGVRDQAVDKLAKFGVKALPAVVKSISGGNYYLKRNACRVIAKIAKVDAEWAFYDQHFKISDTIIPLLNEQSSELSFTVRNAANQALVKIAGKGVGFIENTDQFRTAAQLAAQGKWKESSTASKKSYEKAQLEREKTYKKTLLDWEDGPADESKKVSKKSKASRKDSPVIEATKVKPVKKP
ncbi:MAG: hypothetical protein P1V97_01620 [Planctomycetota bacterium]|nr:hypothetical protein [Planctomycetota bacterium]